MDLKGKNVGFAMTGSFCTLSRVLKELEKLAGTGATVFPIMSEIVYSTDTRFGSCEEFRNRMEMITGNPIIKSVKEAEPIGPKKLLDVLVVAPCTGNTLGKLANGITDSSVSMAVKAHLRNDRPVVLGIATNDGLSGSAANIGTLLVRKNFYFVPFGQDDAFGKPCSLIADFSMVNETVEAALRGKQIQPLLRV